MKKNVKSLLIAGIITTAMLFTTACGQSKDEPLNLDGTWRQTDGDSYYQEAVIKGDTITINWIDEEEDTESLYWAGSVDIPTDKTTKDEYSWDSKNDTEKTEFALLASDDETKTFTYKDGIISYKASALGSTKTMKLKKVDK